MTTCHRALASWGQGLAPRLAPVYDECDPRPDGPRGSKSPSEPESGRWSATRTFCLKSAGNGSTFGEIPGR
ncbi:MAG: hypothetical protein R6U98_24965, partial [Pirellulaceae bacterium]